MRNLAEDLDNTQDAVDDLLDEIAANGNEKTADAAKKAKEKTRRISNEIAVVINMDKDK